MDAEIYLEKVRKIDMMIINKGAEVQQWKSIANGSTSGMDGSERVQSSGNQQKMADAVIMYMSIEDEIQKLIKAKDDISKTIQELPALEYNILHKMYFQNMSYNDIATECKKSYSWVAHNRKRALANLQGILDEKSLETLDSLNFLSTIK